MDFQITFDPFLDFMIRMFVIGGAIVMWTIITIWIIAEVKSWFPKDEETDISEEELDVLNAQEPHVIFNSEAAPHFTIKDDGTLVQNVPISPTRVEFHSFSEAGIEPFDPKENASEINRRRH